VLTGLTVCYLSAIIFMAVRQSIQMRDYLERKMLMAKEDIAVKQYLKVKERFADAYNANMFGGRQVIKPEELSEINAESDIIEECKKVIFKNEESREEQTKRALWRYRDIVMKWRGMILMILACEIQDKVHYAMPVRGMLYDALSYTDRMYEIWEHLSEEERKSVGGAEFFSRFRKEDVLYPVVTLVFYYGKEAWDGSLELYDMFKISGEADMEAIKEFVANYKVKLVDVSNIKDLSVYQSDLREVLGFVRCRENRTALLEYANANKEFFEAVDYETVNAIGAMVQGGEKYIKMIKDSEKEEKVNMCRALEDLWEDGVKTGEERGIRLGEERGIKLGEERGIKLGEIRGIQKAVLLLRRVGTSDDVIVDMIKSEYNHII